MAATHAVEGYDAFRSKVAELAKVGVGVESRINLSSMWFYSNSHDIDETFSIIIG
jgi:hypothetical protein